MSEWMDSYRQRLLDRDEYLSPGSVALREHKDSQALAQRPEAAPVSDLWEGTYPDVSPLTSEVPDPAEIEARGEVRPQQPGLMEQASEALYDAVRPVVEPFIPGSQTDNPAARALVGGATDAVRELFVAGGELAEASGFELPFDPRELPQIPEGDSAAESMVRGVTRFFTAFAGSGGFAKGAGYLSRMGSGAIADALMDPEEGNFATFLREMNVDNTFINWLDSEVGEDAEAEERLKSRLKQTLDGAMIGGVFDLAWNGLKYIKEHKGEIAERLAEFGQGPAPGSPAAQLGMVSFHGSPHKFDAFDLSKVGTGEGAQAYGHGVYLAENPDVAKSYLPVADDSSGLYEVEVPDEAVDAMLDWDAPFSEQPDAVKQAIADNPLIEQMVSSPTANHARIEDYTGGEIYKGLLYETDIEDQKGVSDYLASLGVPGIKYFDAGSRAAGEGTRNFVVFDENMAKITKRNEEPISQGMQMPDGSTYQHVAGERISTRVPSTKNPPEDAYGEERLQIGLEAMRRDPKQFDINMGLIADHTPVRAGRTADETAENYIQMAQKNLEFLFDSVPEEIRRRSKHWYDGANRMASEKARHYGRPIENVAGVYASLSPRKDWFQNIELGNRVMDILSTKSREPWSTEMDGWAARKYTTAAQQALLAKIAGKRLEEISDPFEKAAWIRAYDEAHNKLEYNAYSPEGDALHKATNKDGVTPTTLTWQSNDFIADALKSFDAADIRTISDAMGRQHKVRSFYNNIVDPMSPAGDVTMDTHAVAAAVLQPHAAKDVAVAHNLGSTPHKDLGVRGAARVGATGSSGTYGINAEAYRRAAAARGVSPREMQSITWEAVRGLFDNKSAKMKRDVDAIWREYTEGTIEQDEAQRRVLELAGGINDPEWHK